MLPKKQRIERPFFDLLLKKGRSTHTSLFSVSVLSAETLKQHSKFGVVVSKKVAKQAVTRNKLRRRAYAVFSKEHGNIKKGFLVALFFKKPAAELSFSETASEIKKLLHKANLYEKNTS